MSIIMVDCDDCYYRAKKFAEMSEFCAQYARLIGSENEILAKELLGFSEEFLALSKDITAETDVWTEFYLHNVRTD